MRSRNVVVALVVIGLVAAGCRASPAGGASLEGTQWVLVELDGEPPLSGTEVTAKFSADQIEGTAGCNHYSGAYSVDGDEITVGNVARTEMYCMDPEGVMDQEGAFFAALESVARYRLAEDRLELLDSSSTVILAFEKPGAGQTSQVTQPTEAAPPPETAPPEEPTPIPTESQPTPAPQVPAGFRRYEDPVTGVAVYAPEGWVVTGIVEGQSAILQSYPEDKYIGGEPREPGDTKCDLTIRPPDISVADAVQAVRADTLATIVSEQEIVLPSGQPGIRAEVESMGPSVSLFTETGGRTVIFTCFGDPTPFDEIAGTVGMPQ